MITRRPWGTFEVLGDGEGYQVKRLTIQPGQAISLQYHEHREEHWVVVGGQGWAQIDDRIWSVAQSDSVRVLRERRHRLSNSGSEDLVVIEVQLGEWLAEEDIVRLADEYGRA